MKKMLFSLLALTLPVYAQEPVPVKITGDRVSLRAAPDTNAVLLGRAMLGDELPLRDNSNPDWVGVQPPESVDLWVNSEFVISNTVVPEILNIRSGPSLSHSTVGTAHKGDVLKIRGEAGGWLKIQPTTNSVTWISRKYAAVPGTAVEEPAAAPAQEPATVMQVVTEAAVTDVMTSVTTPASPGSTNNLKKLKMNMAKQQGVTGTYRGVLKPVDDMLYKLVDDYFTDVTVCYVYGNKPQMLTFAGMKIELIGKAYWAEGKDLPVIIPSRIRLFPTETGK